MVEPPAEQARDIDAARARLAREVQRLGEVGALLVEIAPVHDVLPGAGQGPGQGIHVADDPARDQAERFRVAGAAVGAQHRDDAAGQGAHGFRVAQLAVDEQQDGAGLALQRASANASRRTAAPRAGG